MFGDQVKAETRTIKYLASGSMADVAMQTLGWASTLVRGVLDLPGVQLALCTGVAGTLHPDVRGVVVVVHFRAVYSFSRFTDFSGADVFRLPAARVYGWGEFPWWMVSAVRCKFASPEGWGA